MKNSILNKTKLNIKKIFSWKLKMLWGIPARGCTTVRGYHRLIQHNVSKNEKIVQLTNVVLKNLVFTRISKKINTIVKRPFSVQFSQIIALYFHMLKHCDIEVVMHSNEVIFSPFSFGNVQGFFGKQQVCAQRKFREMDGEHTTYRFFSTIIFYQLPNVFIIIFLYVLYNFSFAATSATTATSICTPCFDHLRYGTLQWHFQQFWINL